MRRQVAEVVATEFAEGADEGLAMAHGRGGEMIGLVFVASRPAAEKWTQPEGEQATEHQGKQEQGTDSR
jgi:hypothetical protein